MQKQKLVVLTGAGMSAESGIPTFRGAKGLWEGFSIEEVASPQGWQKDQNKVLQFYNERRKGIMEAAPNPGHFVLAALQDYFNVQIITQNIDNLHERAGSKNVLHLHGEIMKARSTSNSNLLYELDHWELKKGDLCAFGSQLRPHIVWFGEPVPKMDDAIEIVESADLLVIVGTSMLVYPAAGLIDFLPLNIPVYCIDPTIPPLPKRNPPIFLIQQGASEGLNQLKTKLVG